MILTDNQRLVLIQFVELQMNLALKVDSFDEREELILRLMKLVNPQESYKISNKQEKDFNALITSYFENPSSIFHTQAVETKLQENQILRLLFRVSALKYLNDLLKEKSALPNELTQKWINNSAIILKNELNDLTKTIKKFIETELETIKNMLKSLETKKKLSVIPFAAGNLYLTFAVVSSYFVTTPVAVIISSLITFNVTLCASAVAFFKYHDRILDEPAASIKNSPLKKYLETEDINEMSINDLENKVKNYLINLDGKINDEIKSIDKFFLEETYKNISETLNSSESHLENSKAEETQTIDTTDKKEETTIRKRIVTASIATNNEVRIIVPEEPAYPNYLMLP